MELRVYNGNMKVKDYVLKALQEKVGSYISGEDLSDSLHVSRAAVWKAINALREEGYTIEAVTNRGYVLRDSTEDLTEAGIRNGLSSKYKRNSITVYDSTDSTNLRAKQMLLDLNDTKIHGAVIAASQQTAGRGRLGRSFFSPQDGIYLSIIIRPEFDMSKSQLITVAAAAAVSRAIDEVCFGLNPDSDEPVTMIKWVNDLYISGLKVCGILTEATTDFETGTIQNLIIGIGINRDVSNFPEELRGIAGAVEGDYSSSLLAARVVENTLNYVHELNSASEEKQSYSFLDVYRGRNMLEGKSINVYKGVYRDDPTKEIGGVPARALGIDDSGGLMVEYFGGSIETLTAGEVSVRK